MENNSNPSDAGSAKFSEGDIFYTHADTEYHIFKVLKADDAYSTYHIMAFEPVATLPDNDEVHHLDVAVYHMPIDQNGFESPTLLAKREVTFNDLTGYHEYLRQTANITELAAEANRYFMEGYRLTDAKKLDDAITAYSNAIELIPQFYEAIDNRAFCKMDLGQWQEAIEDFNLSLQQNPESVLAEFSIGECLMRLGDYTNAITQFEKALAIDPSHDVSKRFLEKARSLLKE
ncbi:tetratricopeptide repeat protein [Chryseolinea lacunae]|uniref:Tetratricopeptide repeat protein n=1 Tax=Chryseolinea lacunae TaxID=2801331 RepID=A0ABS1KTC0_9BACT|nr:tetratricopeptide repeat protein [Chryseolinea lacunae]MBL0742568.1 tetratricopeptide repeat protein [Chryseolinea lacunae]